MIDEKVFKDSWALLCDRFGRQHSQPLMLAYYRSLSPRMNTDQFRAASQYVFDFREFFPRPADFLEAVKPDTEAEALEEWNKLQELMRGFNPPEPLTQKAKDVVALLGGISKLRNTPLDSVQWVRKDFLEMYGDAAKVAEREAGHRIAPTPEGNRLTAEIMAGAKRLAPPA